MCNVTISSRAIKARSGQAFGEIKSPTRLSGPAFCWYRFEAEPGERVELQIYRIKRLGELNTETNRCVGGFLQLSSKFSGTEVDYAEDRLQDPDELAICGPNERYSPPIVMFKDPKEGEEDEKKTAEGANMASAAASATLLFRVDETTSRSQFLAHFAFPAMDHPDTGVALKGATRLDKEGDRINLLYFEDCVWKFEENVCQQNGGGVCQIASPGYPGIYPPNQRCRYHIQASSKDVQTRLTFTHFNLPPELCDTHYVEVIKGSKTDGKILKSLCGYKSSVERVTTTAKHLTVEFVSGSVTPPINYNGFKATIEFLPRNKRQRINDQKNSDQDQDEPPRRRGNNGGRRRDSDGSQRTTRRRDRGKKPISNSNNNNDPTNQCVQEFNANESRTGVISSSSLSLNNQGCTLIFRGNPGDVLLISINSFKLRGKGCEAFIRISQPFSSMSLRRTSHEDTEEVELICSPATRRIYDGQGRYVQRPPILVNSSTVFLQFQANRQNVDRFEAAFAFHDVMSDGLPSPNGTCDALFPGRTGHPKGTLESPGKKSHLFQRLEGPLQCTKSLVPSDSQSLTLTVANSNAPPSLDTLGIREPCETLCDERGCHCLADGNEAFEDIDHLIVRAKNGGRVACFCGSFSFFFSCSSLQHLLPLNIISSSSLSVVYNVVDFKASRKLSYSASFAFHNEETCGARRISTPQGSLESPLAPSSEAYHPSSTYFHQECQWFFDPPPARQLILKISTAHKMSDCLTWNATIAIWNPKLSDQIGTLIDRFCPEISAKEYILNITARKIVISLHSLSMGPIHYRISWETRGLLPSDPSGDHTKEVIGGGLLSSGTSSSLTALCNGSFLVNIWISIFLGLLTLTA
eukprot:13342.XXX_253715_241698_1 [CDS] Oithona nana genome sequencing.